MRTLTLTLSTEDGKLSCEQSFPSKPLNPEGLMLVATGLEHRLDVLERDGPWNNGEPSQGKEGPAIFHERVVQNSLQPAPEEQSKA